MDREQATIPDELQATIKELEKHIAKIDEPRCIEFALEDVLAAIKILGKMAQPTAKQSEAVTTLALRLAEEKDRADFNKRKWSEAKRLAGRYRDANDERVTACLERGAARAELDEMRKAHNNERRSRLQSDREWRRLSDAMEADYNKKLNAASKQRNAARAERDTARSEAAELRALLIMEMDNDILGPTITAEAVRDVWCESIAERLIAALKLDEQDTGQ